MKPLQFKSLAGALLILALWSTPAQAAPSSKSPHILHTPVRDTTSQETPRVKNADAVNDLLNLAPSSTPITSPSEEQNTAGYRINFTNVSAAEYLRFVAKIGGRNFVYQESDLQFPVTIVSEQPTSVEDVTAALMQVLRIHGFTVSEQGKNILIYKDAVVGKLAPVIVDDQQPTSAFITRVIHLSNIPVAKAQSVIAPLLSPQALVDGSQATNQLIITDLASSINTAMQLLAALDQPFEALDVVTFVSTHGDTTVLARLATEILTPMAVIQGMPLVLVDQPSIGAIFIVAPKALQNKILQVLQALDQPGSHQTTSLDVLIYIPKNLKPEALLPLANQVLQPIAEAEKVPLNVTIQAATNSLIISSTKAFNIRVLDVLQSLDQPPQNPNADLSLQSGPVEVATFIPKNVKPEALVSVASQILQPIADTEKIPFSLVIQGSTNTIFISSTRGFNHKAIDLLMQLDQPSTQPNADLSVGSTQVEVTSYTPTKAKPESLVTLATKILQPLADSEQVPFSMTVQPSTNSIFISSTRAFNTRALDLLAQLDKPTTNNNDLTANTGTEVVSYMPKFNSPDALVPVAEKILLPIAHADKIPFAMVIQPLTKAIYISSTHDFNIRALDLLQQLDQQAPHEEVPSASKAITVEVASYQPQHLPADALLNVAQKIMAPIADADAIPFSMVVQGSSNAIFVTSTASFNARVLSVLAALDQQSPSTGNKQLDLPATNVDTTTFWIYKLQYQTGSQIQTSFATLGSNLQNYGGANHEIMDVINNAIWIQGTNSIMFTGTATAVYRMQQLMPQIDVPTRQVYIEMLIINTTLSNALNFGVQIGSLVNTKGGMHYNIGNMATPGGSAPTAGFPTTFQLPPINPGTATSPNLPIASGFTFGSIGNFITHGGHLFGSIGSLVNAIQTETDTKIVMNPKIVAVDSHQATIFIGQNVPFSTSNVVIQTAQQSTAFNVDYRDIGISLQVTPTLGKGDVITLDLVQEVDQVVSNTPINGFPVPTTSKLSTNTRVVVPNGYFLVISGLIQNTKQYTTQGIPCLGCLPVIGGAFSQQSQTYSKDNVIIYMHPRIMDTPQLIAGIGNYESDEFFMNSCPEPCDIDWQTNGLYKSFYRPYERLINDIPGCTQKACPPPPRKAPQYNNPPPPRFEKYNPATEAPGPLKPPKRPSQ